MLSLCPDIQHDNNLKSLCIKIFKEIVKWYQSTQHNYSSMLRQEMSDNIEEFEKKWVDTISSYSDDVIVFDLSYHFSTKLSFFSVADALQKLILCRYSVALDTDFCNKYGINVNIFGSRPNQKWLESKLNDVQMIEIIAKVLADENEDPGFDLSALHEDRDVRSKGTHVAYFEKCLSALRCYNTIRKMIVFLDPELADSLPEFEYPRNDFFDIDDFISRSKFSFDKFRTILVTESLHDIPSQYLETVANLSWDIVIDFDGYTRKYGFSKKLSHLNVQHQLVTVPVSVNTSDMIDHAFTRWYQCGEYQVRTTGKFPSFNPATRSKCYEHLIPGQTPYCESRNKLDRQDTDVFDRVIQLAYNTERPLNIVILSNNSNFVKYIANSCINQDPDWSFFCSWIGFGSMPDDIFFDSYDMEENERLMSEHIVHYNCSVVRFFEMISDRIKSLGWKSRQSEVKNFLLPTEKMPNGKEIAENDRTVLNKYFEVLYLGAEYDAARIKDEVDIFYRGGKASWGVIASGEAVLLSDRSRIDKFIDTIKTSMGISQTDFEKQIFFVRHAAGQGGTTLARQIAWELHKQYPVLELKHAPDIDFQRYLQTFYDRVVEYTPFVILCDDAEPYVDDLIKAVSGIRRRFSVIISVRENNFLLRKHRNVNSLPFSTLNEDMIGALKIKFRSNSQLREETLRKKDEDFDEVLIEKKPFFIGLYYREEDFNVEEYVRKTLENAQDDGFRTALACIAMCDIMGQKRVPVLLIRKMTGLSLRDDVFSKFPDAESLILYEDDRVPYYSFRHNLLAMMYLDLYTKYVNKQKPDVYFDLGKQLITYGAEACRIKPSTPILDLLISVIIQNRDDDENTTNIKLSKYLSNLGTPDQRISILRELVDAFEEKAREFFIGGDFKSDESQRKTITLVSHAYAHLGRNYSKWKSNFEKAAECLGLARSYMLGHDPDIYHMEGIALHEKLKYQLSNSRDNAQEEQDEEENLALFERILELYDNTTHYNSPEYGIPSKLTLCRDMLQYLCEKKQIKERNHLSRLSYREQEVFDRFTEALEEVDIYGIENDTYTENTVYICKGWLRSGQIFGNTSEVVAYYRQQYDKCNKEDAYSTNRSLLSLVYAQIEHYRQKHGTKAFHRYLERNRAFEMLKNIQLLLDAPYNQGSSVDYFKRTRLYSEWFQLAKTTDQYIPDCIIQAQAWRAMEEEYADQKKCKRNPAPWYYLMAFYYLEALEGGTTSSEEALRYQKEMLDDQRFNNQNIYSRTFYDLIVEGRGAGQLLNVKHCRTEEEILKEVVKHNASPKIVKGTFLPTASGAGEICLSYPMYWKNVSVHVRYGKSYPNTLNGQLMEHKIETPLGFAQLRPHALSAYAKDISADEQFDWFSIKMIIKRSLEKENKQINPISKKHNRRRKR